PEPTVLLPMCRALRIGAAVAARTTETPAMPSSAGEVEPAATARLEHPALEEPAGKAAALPRKLPAAVVAAIRMARAAKSASMSSNKEGPMARMAVINGTTVE